MQFTSLYRFSSGVDWDDPFPSAMWVWQSAFGEHEFVFLTAVRLHSVPVAESSLPRRTGPLRVRSNQNEQLGAEPRAGQSAASMTLFAG